MAVYDQSSDLKVINAINTQALSSDTTTAGAIIDTQGFDALTFVLKTGAVSAGDATLLIEESDDSGFSTSNEVADGDLIGTEAATTLDAANKTSKIGYVGKNRYVRASVVTDNSANLTVGAVAILGEPKTAPQSDQTP